jgi:hypothetical protein
MKDYVFSFTALAIVLLGYSALVLAQPKSLRPASHDTPMAALLSNPAPKSPMNLDATSMIEKAR